MKWAPLLVLLAGCGNPLGEPGVASWPMVGHDAQHTSASASAGPSSSPAIAFELATGDDGFVSDPVIDGYGFVYVAIASRNGAAQLYSIEPGGRVRWTVAPCDAPDVRPAIDADGQVDVTCSGILDQSAIVGLTIDGGTRFHVTSGLSDATAPAIGTDGTIYVGSAGVAAYSSAGAPLWQSGDDVVPAPPALDDAGAVYYVDISGQVHGIGATGVESWVTPIDSGLPSGGCGVTMGHEDDLFACFPNGVLARLGTGGTIDWTRKLADSLPWPVAVGPDDTLYFASIDESGASSQATLHAFASDGAERWSVLLDGTGGSTPTLGADGTIYVGDDQAVTAFSPEGVMLWSVALPGSATSIAIAADGRLVVGASDGTVHALGP